MLNKYFVIFEKNFMNLLTPFLTHLSFCNFNDIYLLHFLKFFGSLLVDKILFKIKRGKGQKMYLSCFLVIPPPQF